MGIYVYNLYVQLEVYMYSNDLVVVYSRFARDIVGDIDNYQ